MHKYRFIAFVSLGSNMYDHYSKEFQSEIELSHQELMSQLISWADELSVETSFPVYKMDYEKIGGSPMNKGIEARGTDNAKVIQVIQTTALAGDGSPENPCRRVVQYWDFDGTLLFTEDPEDKLT